MSSTASRPHIIYILSDEHFGGAMTHAGDPNVRTPHLDRMAAEGVSFARAYANCPICTPSRGTIFSGRHAHAGPVQFFFDCYKATAPSIATALRAAGYHTAYFGKWHCGYVRDQSPPAVRANPARFNPQYPTRTPEYHRGGFQDWFAFEINNQPFQPYYWEQHAIDPCTPEEYQTDLLTRLALDYLQAYDRPEPLFLVLSIEPPHFPLVQPPGTRQLDPAALQLRPNAADTADMRAKLAAYYAMVENLDANVGRLQDALATLPTFRNRTLSIYFSDHGDFMGSHGLINRKELPHEESVRIPAIFHWPGQIPPRASRPEALFSLVDLQATVLSLVGAPVPPHDQGVTFAPLLRGEPFAAPAAVLLEMSGNPRWNLDFLDWRGLVTPRWKYAFFETGHEVLFDLAQDPGEQHNLAAGNAAACAPFRRQLLALLADAREPYFDVLIEHGVPPPAVTLDVSGRTFPVGAPVWQELVRRTPA